MPARPNRRRFLQAGAAGLGYLYTGPASSVARAAGANDRLRFAGIGVGGKGSSDIDHAALVGDVVAICDIDEQRLDSKANQKGLSGKPKGYADQHFTQARKFTDWRKLLDDAASFDAVVISTPDHSHAPPAVRAILAGKHVYCQKPLTHTVFEARLLRDLAAKHKVCTQMGNQGTAENGLRRAVEFVQAGNIGQVKEIHVWTNRPVWNQAPDVMKRPAGKDAPKHIHWDDFLGPAPDRAYAPGYHPFGWRGFLDFGTGALGDMACHTANMAFMACKLGHPTDIIGEARDLNGETYPTWAKVRFEFPARGEMGPCTFFWYEGREGGRNNKAGKKVLPPDELLSKVLKPGQKLADSGSMLVGDKGILFSPNDYGAKAFVVAPDGESKELTGNPEKLPANGGGDPGMKKEWAEAIKAGKPAAALSNFDYAGALTETILLGNIAIRLSGRPLAWDGPNLKFDYPEATKLVTKEYRKGWELATQRA